MDSAEKIQSFNSFEELTREIMRDRESSDMRDCRYAIRFIMLNNFNTFRELAKFMANIGVNDLNLEDLIDDDEDDTWITKDVLRKSIEAQHESTFITPFSELVRFYDDDEFRGFFNEIMLLEDTRHPDKRIYVPLIGLQNRFSDFLNHFARLAESGPVWRYDAEKQPVEVYFARYKNFILPRGEVQCQLDSLREWLKFWKVQAPQERIVCTSRPIAAKFKHSKPDNIFNFTRIANAYEFMTQYLDLSFPFGYEAEESAYWEVLLTKIDKNRLSSFSFDAFTRSYFNKVTFDAIDILTSWAGQESGDFERWLLSKYVMHTDFANKHPYIATCMATSTDYSDASVFVEQVASRLIYEPSKAKRSEYSRERKEVMVRCANFFRDKISFDTQQRFFERIKEVFQREEDLSAALELCTGIFDFEHILLMGWLAHNHKSKSLLQTIQSAFPEFEAYLGSTIPSNMPSEQQWFVEYLKAYKWAKLTDKYTEEISAFISSLNKNASEFFKWYYQFEESHSVLGKLNQNTVLRPDKIYWIDGLGAEHLAYILYLIEKENTNLKVVDSQFSRSELPSSTHHNRFDGANVKKFEALDALGHDSHGYRYLYTLEKELKVLKEIIREILNSSKQEKCTVAIVSDHGLSCLSRKAPSKKYDGPIEHEGRYMKTTDDAAHDPDYLVYHNESEDQYYKVALTHSSLGKLPTHQVHGGCTPEEVIVPFLLLSNKDVTSNIRSQVILDIQEIPLSKPIVTVTIIPEPKSVELSCKGKVYNMKREGTKWSAQLEDITEGSHEIEIKPHGQVSKTLPIQVLGLRGSTDIDSDFDL